MVIYVEALARSLRSGASADIWYDAEDHVTSPGDPTDPDVRAADAIDEAQTAMVRAADALTTVHDLLTRLDGAARVNGLCRTHGPLLDEVRRTLDELGAKVEDPEPEAASPSP